MGRTLLAVLLLVLLSCRSRKDQGNSSEVLKSKEALNFPHTWRPFTGDVDIFREAIKVKKLQLGGFSSFPESPFSDGEVLEVSSTIINTTTIHFGFNIINQVASAGLDIPVRYEMVTGMVVESPPSGFNTQNFDQFINSEPKLRISCYSGARMVMSTIALASVKVKGVTVKSNAELASMGQFTHYSNFFNPETNDSLATLEKKCKDERVQKDIQVNLRAFLKNSLTPNNSPPLDESQVIVHAALFRTGSPEVFKHDGRRWRVEPIKNERFLVETVAGVPTITGSRFSQTLHADHDEAGSKDDHYSFVCVNGERKDDNWNDRFPVWNITHQRKEAGRALGNAICVEAHAAVNGNTEDIELVTHGSTIVKSKNELN